MSGYHSVWGLGIRGRTVIEKIDDMIPKGDSGLGDVMVMEGDDADGFVPEVVHKRNVDHHTFFIG